MTGELEALSGRDFDAVVDTSPVSVIVAFTADWCAPCAWLKPYLYAIVERAGGSVGVFTVDVDEAPDLTGRLGIGSVPTVLFFRDGLEADRSVGVEPHRFEQWLEVLGAEEA